MRSKCLPEIVKAKLIFSLDSVSPSLTQRRLARSLPIEAGLVLADTFFSRTDCAIHVDILCSSSFPYSSIWLLPPFPALSIPPALAFWNLLSALVNLMVNCLKGKNTLLF